ncbi:MAG: HD domain-containing protein [Clostridia bacterium]|nr:HD domain-containing protein [Clostridia bacterium]
MTKKEFDRIEAYMLTQMQDAAHDRHHVYRVLNAALDIAGHVDGADMDVLTAACLLHDIGREAQAANLELCHAQIGGEMAFDFLVSQGWAAPKAQHVRECITSHRYRGDNQPQSMEAKILFDADKLEVTGAIGIARTLIYAGQVGEPLYILGDDGDVVLDGGGAEITSFFQEYNWKLKKVYDAFYTERAKEIARGRQKASMDFYDGLLAEVRENYKHAASRLIK